MIAPDRPPLPDPVAGPAAASLPPGLAATARASDHELATGERLTMLVIPLVASPTGDADPVAEAVRHWVSAAADSRLRAIFVPLYGCFVGWAAGRAALVGPPDRLDQLTAAVLEFAGLEANLREAERLAASLLDTLEDDVSRSLSLDEHASDRRGELASRHREAVSVGRRLALLRPAVEAPPLHPPTLASQLGERLRERARLVERHEFATDRAELAERVTEACGQRALETGIARRQAGLEWAIVVLLVVQTVMLLVDLVAGRAAP